jgi:hypothetical protein
VRRDRLALEVEPLREPLARAVAVAGGGRGGGGGGVGGVRGAGCWARPREVQLGEAAAGVFGVVGGVVGVGRRGDDFFGVGGRAQEGEFGF